MLVATLVLAFSSVALAADAAYYSNLSQNLTTGLVNGINDVIQKRTAISIDPVLDDDLSALKPKILNDIKASIATNFDTAVKKLESAEQKFFSRPEWDTLIQKITKDAVTVSEKEITSWARANVDNVLNKARAAPGNAVRRLMSKLEQLKKIGDEASHNDATQVVSLRRREPTSITGIFVGGLKVFFGILALPIVIPFGIVGIIGAAAESLYMLYIGMSIGFKDN